MTVLEEEEVEEEGVENVVRGNKLDIGKEGDAGDLKALGGGLIGGGRGIPGGIIPIMIGLAVSAAALVVAAVVVVVIIIGIPTGLGTANGI